MKLANEVISLHEKIDKSDLDAVRAEVIDSFSTVEMKSYKTFDDFFAEVDVQNAHEEEWNAKKWKPYYKIIWSEWENNKLKVKG